MRSTSSGEVGTKMTSLPGCPGSGCAATAGAGDGCWAQPAAASTAALSRIAQIRIRLLSCFCRAEVSLGAKGNRMPLTSLNHYLVVSTNLERSKKFYQSVLGMQVAERPDFGFPGYWLSLDGDICVHLASQNANKIRDQFLLKKHPKGTKGSGSLDHIAFLAKDPVEVRKRI